MSDQSGPGKLVTRSWILLLSIFVLPYLWPRLQMERSLHSSISHAGDLHDFLVVSNLTRRDEYSCSAEKPCSNSACCGKSGYCGYGPTYCGDGCVSNCDAVAECGKDAKQKGQECPLNTCCSKYGFCGTTKDFCGTGCQSNCVLNPSPPASTASLGIIQNKVIGYYESWSAQKDCHKINPTDLPVDALTHLNFAFAYIKPGTFEVVTMDSTTPSSLFQDVTDLKTLKKDLQVFISIGGWTFSDNNTATQPVFGEIAADASKRQKFSDNLVHFMKQYRFDGVDIDWEYPGAPDRGGRPEDKDNFVTLLETLRKTLDASGQKFGLTFTAPTSYWYLRWFDLPGLVKHVDWINLMSYDLHGEWDRTNPIGSVVQGHTNLTEIKIAAELFWRVNISPDKLVMGFGFYGRSFTLADTSCTSPGCPFKDTSIPGPCTNASGMLAHYEIQNILKRPASKKRAAIVPKRDNESAVNYVVFDNDQWVSYDDAVTFKQKIDWANSIGIGGAMVWASDLDDDKFSAHKGLIGRDVISNSALGAIQPASGLNSPQNVITDLSGDNGQQCFVSKGKCVDLNDDKAVQNACGNGFTAIGFDDSGCGKKHCHCGKPICCPTDSAPKNCIWRGDNNGGVSSDCSGQCLPGEMNIAGIRSSWGGGFLNDGDTNKCGRGYKTFCCPDPKFRAISRNCAYAPCGANCPSGTTSMFSKVDNCIIGHQKYCCQTPADLTSCHWVVKTNGIDGDCSNAKCNATELEIDRSTYGDGATVGCDWGRKKSACCTVIKAPPPVAYCADDLCKSIPGLCNTDEDTTDDNQERTSDLVKRGDQQQFMAGWPGRRGARYVTFPYLSLAIMFGFGRNAPEFLRTIFRTRQGPCDGSTITQQPIPYSRGTPDTSGLDAEHIIDRNFLGRFITDSGMLGTNQGKLPSGRFTDPPLAPIPQYFWTDQLHQQFPGLERHPALYANGHQSDTPNDRITECLGSRDNMYPFTAADKQINGMKLRVIKGKDPVSVKEVQKRANTAVTLDTQAASGRLLTAIRAAFTVFDYMNNPDAAARFHHVRQQIRLQLTYIQQEVIEPTWTSGGYPHDPEYPLGQGIPDIVAWWDQWSPDFFANIEAGMQRYMTNIIEITRSTYSEAENPPGRDPQVEHEGYLLRTTEEVLTELELLMSRLDELRFPPGPSDEPPNNKRQVQFDSIRAI